MEQRTCKVFNEKTKMWDDILPENIKKGMLIKMFEPDGTEVAYIGENHWFETISDSYMSDEGYLTFQIRVGL